MVGVRKNFSELMQINQVLIRELKVRSSQGSDLQQALKEMKEVISKAGNLRSKPKKSEILNSNFF